MKKIFYSVKNSRLSQLISLLTIFFMINIFHVVTLHPMFTAKPKPYKRSFKEAVKVLNKLDEIPKKRGILIFLDEVEKHMTEAVGGGLVNGLYQAENPIIVSHSLMCNLLEYRERDKRSVQDLIVERGKLNTAGYFLDGFKKKYGANWLDEIYRKEAVICCKIAFKPDQWIIKEINNSLLLLIPYKYCDSLGVNGESVKEYTNISNDIELKMGFRVNHMKTLEHTSIYRSSLKKYFYQYIVGIDSSVIFRFADYFINSLDAIFCEKSDYNIRNSIITEWHDYQSKNIPIPEWVIYIMGHGLKNDSIADMRLNDFKKFLIFLENKIKTGLLFVVSCQVAGVNVNQIYGDIKSGTQQYNSFPIIIQGISDALSFTNPLAIDFNAFWGSMDKNVLLHQGFKQFLESGNLRIKGKDFAEFFKRASDEEGNYRKIVEPLIDKSSIANELQIKMPGIEWFSLIDTQNKVVSIGSILAKTRNPETPLNVASFFKKNPEIILLYTDNIPFELQIDLGTLKAIGSMVSSDPTQSGSAGVVQRIKKISLSKHEPLSRIFELFKPFIYTQGTKEIFIEEINDANRETYKDILIRGTYEDGMDVYLKDEHNFLHKFNLNKKQETVSILQRNSYEERFYNERIRMARHRYPELSERIEKKEVGIDPQHLKDMENILKQHAVKIKKQRELEEKRTRDQTLIE